MNKTRSMLSAALLLASLASRSEAEQRALLVGVGQYVTPGIDLPAIDLDIERMHDTLIRMGFEEGQIKTLVDADATSRNVIANFESWLKAGVKADDRVVFYFTGHGSQIPDIDGDEPDGVDEVLVTHDMVRARLKGRASLANVITDDKLGAMIAAIPSQNVWIIIDSCHSGTVTRSFSLQNRSLGTDPVFVKSFTYTGMPDNKKSLFKRDVKSAKRLNYVSLSAAADNEQAIGTSKGGVFTIGLTESIKHLADAGKAITVNELRAETTQYISTKVDKEDAHHPQIAGNPELADGKLNIVAVKPDVSATVAMAGAAGTSGTSGASGASNANATAATTAPAPVPGPNLKRLLQLASAQAKHVEVSSPVLTYVLDQPVTLRIAVPTPGYLNVVTVDPQDTATVLFPNRHLEDNAVTPGTFELPAKSMDFELLASEPRGPTTVVAFLSTEPINFYRETLENRDQNGNITVDFPALSPTATRAIRVSQRRKDIYSGKLELQIVAPAPDRK